MNNKYRIHKIKDCLIYIYIYVLKIIFIKIIIIFIKSYVLNEMKYIENYIH